MLVVVPSQPSLLVLSSRRSCVAFESRIDITVPHYIRCLKPNDDLVPDYFEPKNIVEQLRCGGVLEAVRVSRAGYPTRYPHDIFMARYYILGDHKDDSPMSPLFSPGSSTDRQTDLKRLVSKIAFDLWYVDHQIMLAHLEAEKLRSGDTPKKFQQVSHGLIIVELHPFHLSSMKLNVLHSFRL